MDQLACAPTSGSGLHDFIKPVHWQPLQLMVARSISTVSGSSPQSSWLTIQKGPYTFAITVERISKQRRPAVEARTLYTESEESAQERQALYRQRKLEGHSAKNRERRPDKRTRRLIHRFKQQT